MLLLFVIMGISSEHDSGDRIVCGAGIAVFCIVLYQEARMAAMLFGFLVGAWASIVQPAVLNRCHLTLWILIFEAVRNSAIVEHHSTLSWGHSAAGHVFGLFQPQRELALRT